MIDRKKGPIITTEFDLSVKGVTESILANNIALVEVNDGTQDIIKAELVFPTGRIHETKIAAAKATIALLREGSTRHNAKELAHIYDYYGAVVKASCTMEYASMSLVIVERYFAEVWPIWLHMVFYPLFAEEEVAKYKKVYSQKLVESLSQNDVQSYRELTELIFGSAHPYGYNTQPADIAQLQKEDLLDFYNQNMGIDNSFMILSGKYTEETRNTITNSLVQITRKNQHPEPSFKETAHRGGRHWVMTDNEIQTSIKIGRTLFPIKHPDYTILRLLNTILGGYFGSRLMKNIREDKGYTYGIYSAVHCWTQGGFIYISADVDPVYEEPTLEQIELEMTKLTEEVIPEAELTMVKNYVLGQTLHLLDGPFAKGQLVKNLKVKQLDLDLFNANVEQIKNLGAEELRTIARKYLNFEDYTIVMAGNK